jgi:hypothetical protein
MRGRTAFAVRRALTPDWLAVGATKSERTVAGGPGEGKRSPRAVGTARAEWAAKCETEDAGSEMKQATVECGGEVARVGQRMGLTSRANVVGGKRRSATVEGAGATPKVAQSMGLSRHAAVG